MKKALVSAVILTSAIMMGTMTVHAENTAAGKSDITLYVENDPVYTVTVPETISLSATENTQVPITASDMKYIPDGKKLSVTLTKGSGVFGRLYMVGTNEETGKDYTMTLCVKGTDGEFKSGALQDQIKGMELAAFTGNGTENYELRPVALDYPDSDIDNLVIQKGVHYSASVTYGMELTDIE